MRASSSQGAGWVTVQFVLMVSQLAAVAFRRSQWPAPGSCAAGAALIAAAAAYGLPGTRSLGRNLTPLPEPKADGELVTSGVYAHVRHPLYASVMSAGLGWALVWRSWPALILALVQVLFFREKARHEETRLRARFPDYAGYAKRVPPFVPRITTERRR